MIDYNKMFTDVRTLLNQVSTDNNQKALQNFIMFSVDNILDLIRIAGMAQTILSTQVGDLPKIERAIYLINKAIKEHEQSLNGAGRAV